MPTEPWAAYPPEMNAARILGSGPAGLLVAAANWVVKSAQTAAGQGVFMAQNANQIANIEGAVSDTVGTTAPPFGTWLNDFSAESARNALEYQQFAQAYFSAMGTMVPLPVIAANRAASAAGHAASAAGAVNPVGVAADAAYEGYRVQNASTMTVYDAVATGTSTPRAYVAPPPLVTGGSVSGARTAEDVANAAVQAAGLDQAGAVQGAVSQAHSALGSPSTMAGLNSTAAGVGPYGAVPTTVSPLAAQQVAMAMSPAAMVAGQMATPQAGGVTPAGLGSGSAAMAPMRGVSGGGLPLASSMGSSVGSGSGAGSSVSTSTGGNGGGSSRPNLSNLASLLGGSGAGAGAGAGAPAAPGAPGAPAAPGGGAARPFSGIPSNLGGGGGGGGTGHGPMGAIPPGAQNGQGKGKDKSTIDVKNLVAVDPVAEQQAQQAALARFR